MTSFSASSKLNTPRKVQFRRLFSFDFYPMMDSRIAGVGPWTGRQGCRFPSPDQSSAFTHMTTPYWRTKCDLRGQGDKSLMKSPTDTTEVHIRQSPPATTWPQGSLSTLIPYLSRRDQPPGPIFGSQQVSVIRESSREQAFAVHSAFFNARLHLLFT